MSEALTILYKQTGITPFWKKLPFFFLFPFRFGPAIFMVCIVAASAVAGAVLGGFGLVFKGFLVYLGLRYAFNVLELFAKGRFEGHSPDYSLWGPEKRPAKLGLVIALFIAGAIALGNGVLESRLAKDTAVQDKVVAQYERKHAQELEALRREQEAFDQQMAAARAASASTPPLAQDGDAEEPQDADPNSAAALPAPGALSQAMPDPVRPHSGPSRAEMLEDAKPGFADPLWSKLQPTWYWMVVLLASLVLPSAAIVIVLEDKFFKSLNPALVVYFVQSIGSAYFVLWAFFLAIAGARQFALTAGQNWPMGLGFPLEMALATYLALVLFAMMGYTLYQFHQELGLEVDVDFDDHRQAGGAEAIARAGSANVAIHGTAPADPFERKLQALLKDGNIQEAIAEVKDHMRHARLDPALNTRLHALYAQAGDTATTLAHGQQWLSALAKAGQGRQTVEAVRTLLALDPDFVVADGDVVLPTAKAALDLRDAALAVKLLKGFDKRFPQHPDLPAVLFLGAKLMSEKMRQHDKSAALIRSVLGRFPEHAIAAEARVYLSVLEGVTAKGGSAA